jgi:prepilin-type N-terminal cleavage/methylation domain-containing protein
MQFRTIRDNSARGFTLIELLVVIAVIGILVAIVSFSLSGARASARDKARVADLEQIVLAFQLHAQQNNSYHIDGTGYQGNGQGWLSYAGGTYLASMGQALVDRGYLAEVPHDPLVPANEAQVGDHSQYMRYFAGSATDGMCVFAQLENPTAEHTEAFQNTTVAQSTRDYVAGLNMNYGKCI